MNQKRAFLLSKVQPKKWEVLLRYVLLFLACSFIFFMIDPQAIAQSAAQKAQSGLTIPFVNFQISPNANRSQVAFTVQLIIFLAVLSLSPSIIVLMSSFLRIAIVLDLVRRALSLQNMPPTSVIFGLALFLSIFIMWKPISQLYNQAYLPYTQGKLSTQEFFTDAQKPLRYFMYEQMEGSNFNNVKLFMRMSELPQPNNLAQVPTHVLIPAFVLHELTVAFKMGVLIYIPFVIIDMVVASALMSMGMIMLPPMMISFPFKLILFVMVDGWDLIAGQLVKSFLGG